ncbi:abortive phage resistance protein [Nibribacter ruber]|uniref:Abortive phage resistance protein n=1 Tax=Nibribacter ruber TaxID=2698458 RepID=A0A6P1P201_9BACT|nr:AIPR family protein [Nibribacter ruber]QHL88232.1 abortive phage resistance protein [Nibribacter ruber]
MAETLENLELNKFYANVQQEIRATQLSEDEGGALEQFFTQYAIGLLADAGETENARACYDEKVNKANSVQHKINGYALSDNYETLDLFITIFKGTDEPARTFKEEVDKAAKRITAFFRNAVYNTYVLEIEEASEIFDLAHTLSESKELKSNLVRVNVMILTDGVYPGETLQEQNISGYKVYSRVIDLNYLYNISEKSHVPIEINFQADGYTIPCIFTPSDNEEYQSYLAIIPGAALVNIYERFGSRLLEQNVRSFLQFSGKINKGIRKTILEESHMFLAFNNGLAATAEEVQLVSSPDGYGQSIARVKDLQIVNGGQTTASIYHTWKKDKADISRIFVQVKLSVVKNKTNFTNVVARIAEYANTQNKISASDLSSNSENHIMLEKLSRTIWAPPMQGKTQQTRWFYERARGQYKNAILKEGFTQAKRKAFELKNPKVQVLTKEDIAKYVNSWQQVYEGKKLVVGPHFVVRGNQKNYVQFINYNFESKPDNIYFEDAIAKAILFRAAEKVYGVKPNSIGDMRYITVPYTVAWLGYKLIYKLDLYKIWKAQGISGSLKEKLREIMVKMEAFIKKKAPGSLYGEYAKKEECWEAVKQQDFNLSLESLKYDLESNSKSPKRVRLTEEDTLQAEVIALQERLKSVHPKTWAEIEEWGRATGKLSPYQRTMTTTISSAVLKKKLFSDTELSNGQKILDLAIEEAPELFLNMDEYLDEAGTATDTLTGINTDQLKEVVKWEKKHKKLSDPEYKFLVLLAEGKRPLSDRNLGFISKVMNKVKRFGFGVAVSEVGTAEDARWETSICYWSAVELPGYTYAIKKNAWWKKK